jgi:hypothetical protein
VKSTSDGAGRLVDAAVNLLASDGRLGVLRVLGESMIPTLPAGSVVCVDFAPEEPRRGDLLVFRQAGYLAVHRLIGRVRLKDGRSSFRTRGDGLLAFDPPVERGCVLGRAVAIRRDGTWRDLSTGRARAYAALLALHGLGWVGAGIVAERTADRVLRVLRLRARTRRAVARVDAGLLAVIDRLLFRLVHPPAPPPAGLETGP